MTSRHFAILVYIIIAVSIIDAQRFTKPIKNKLVVDLNKKPPTTTPRLPHERRKLSIFPKSSIKYMVSSKPYSNKVRSFQPWEISTKTPIMQKIDPKNLKSKITTPVTKLPLLKLNRYTTETPMVQVTKQIYEMNTKDVEKFPEDDSFYFQAPRHIYGRGENKHLNNHFVDREYDTDGENTNEVLAFTSLVDNVNSNNFYGNNTEEVVKDKAAENQTVEIESNPTKYLPTGLDEFMENMTDNLLKQNNTSTEDKNEYMLVDKVYLMPVQDKTLFPNSEEVTEEIEDTATERAMLEEYISRSSRVERKINIIEEENLATTVSGFKFTGREPILQSNLVFRNINA